MIIAADMPTQAKTLDHRSYEKTKPGHLGFISQIKPKTQIKRN